MEKIDALLSAVADLAGPLGLTKMFLITDRIEAAEYAAAKASLPVIIATSRKAVERLADPAASNRVEGVLLLAEEVSGGVAVLAQLKEVLLSAYLEGMLGADDRTMCVVTNEDAVDVLVAFDVARDLELTRLRDELEGRVDLRVAEKVLRLASELVREGREGASVGALFVIGDSESVMKRSRQVVLNPFQGYAEHDRNILSEATWETAKEFALLDGAFVIRRDGVILAAGRYVEFDKDVILQSGLGGRHLAAASITSITQAVAVAVSTSGAVRIFKDGRILLKVSRP